MAEPAHRRGAATRAQVPALLKGLIFGPNGRPMSPSHTRRRGRIYRYYVTREAIADGWHLRGHERDGRRRRGRGARPHPEAAGRAGAGRSAWATAKRGRDEITEREVTILLADFVTVWDSCSPPSKRGSSSSSSSGSTCRRMRLRCGSKVEGS